MSASWRIKRRTFLRGVGTAIALPMLDAMLPERFARAAEAAGAKGPAPRRMAFCYIPNGAHMQDWKPDKEGKDFELPAILKQLEPVRGEVAVLTGLACDKARPNGDGPGDHARAQSAFLTCSQPKKTAGADIKVGISVDQLAAQKLGDRTRFPSLELGCEKGSQAGNCDSGYSCAYSANMSWRSESTPVPKEINPKAVFERLFGDGPADGVAATRAKRDAHRKSVLDFALEDANDLKRRLGVRDRQKLDEYLYAIREVETRIVSADLVDQAGRPNIAVPVGVPADYAEHLRIMFDLMALAFQSDQTRIATFMLANDGSNRPYNQIGVREGHHDLSHHGRDKEKQEKISKINQFHMQQFGYFLKRLKSVKEGDSTLLDNSMILYGSGIGDGNRHNHDDLPIVLAGRGGGTLSPGQHVRYRRDTPLANLYVSLLERMGVEVDEFGDSTGRLLEKIS
ncbi:MAG: hypothetical protein DCC68_22580 [Planctomycetota bacterium]|nr:MAG: hypothetical protein DCC68_22580 [Planctomycetota bacterium]